MRDKGGRMRFRQGQKGISTVEVVTASVIALLLIALGGWMFIRQAGSYADLKKVAQTQGALKRSVQAMTRPISSAGAWLGDPRKHFKADSTRLRFAYYDLNGRFCSHPDTLIMDYRLKKGGDADSLMQSFRCGMGGVQWRTLATAPRDELHLAFTYFDSTGAMTKDEARIKSVGISLGLRSGKTGALPEKHREQSLQIEMVNL